MPENLFLQWKDFKENVNSAFGRLRNDREFTDVTLASEDGQQMEAHKVILAASSPFFEEILEKNRHPHPLIWCRSDRGQCFIPPEGVPIDVGSDSVLLRSRALSYSYVYLRGSREEASDDYTDDDKACKEAP